MVKLIYLIVKINATNLFCTLQFIFRNIIVSRMAKKIVYEEPKLARQNKGQWQVWKMWYNILLNWNVLKWLKMSIKFWIYSVEIHFFSQTLEDLCEHRLISYLIF